MLLSKNKAPIGRFSLNQIPIEHVERYTYLGTIVHNQWEMTAEIKSRVEKARSSFVKMMHIFTNRHVSLPLKFRLLKCYVFPVLLYGAEAFEM